MNIRQLLFSLLLTAHSEMDKNTRWRSARRVAEASAKPLDGGRRRWSQDAASRRRFSRAMTPPPGQPRARPGRPMKMSLPRSAIFSGEIAVNNRSCRGRRRRRPSPLHRRSLQQPEAPLSPRLSEPQTVRGPPRPADGQISGLIPVRSEGPTPTRGSKLHAE